LPQLLVVIWDDGTRQQSFRVRRCRRRVSLRPVFAFLAEWNRPMLSGNHRATRSFTRSSMIC